MPRHLSGCLKLIGVHKIPFLWQLPDCCLPSSVWLLSRTTPRSSPDEHHGVAGHLQGGEHQQEAPTAPNLSIPAEEARNHAAQPGLVQRHHLHPRQERLSVSGGNHGLGDPQGAVLAAFQYVGCQLLRGGVGGGNRPIWQARDNEYGPRQPIYRRWLDHDFDQS